MLEACRGDRTEVPLVLRPNSGKPIDRRDMCRMVRRIAKAAGILRYVSPHSLRHAAITNALDAGVRSATPRSSPDTPTHAPPSTTTAPAAISTVTASISSPPTSPASDRTKQPLPAPREATTTPPRKTVSASCPRRQRLPLGTSSTGDATKVETDVLFAMRVQGFESR